MNDVVSKIYKPGNDLWGEPQEYKGLKIYPIKIKDAENIDTFFRIFQIPKNYMPDVKILKMSWLKFYLFVVQPNLHPVSNSEETMGEYFEHAEVAVKLKSYLTAITKETDISWGLDSRQGLPGEDDFDRLVVSMKIGDKVLTEEDFDNIREITLMQGGVMPEYIEQFNPELEKKLAGVNNELGDVSFEDEIFTLAALMRQSLDQVQGYTLYQFRKLMERVMLLENYEQLNPLEVSGQISLKGGGRITTHYLTHVSTKGRYSSIMIGMKDFEAQHPELMPGSNDGNKL
jgi:hypothetical protein